MAAYRNPVIPGFHPDPSVCRVGDDYFLVCSSFTYFPGVPVFRSRNLIDWVPIGHVLDRPSQLDLSATAGWDSCGIYAPTIRYHEGRFWMVTTNVTDEGARNLVVHTDDPAGAWSDPVTIDVGGIDPDLAWDTDGTCWVHSSHFVDIRRRPIDLDTGAALGPEEPTWSGTGMYAPEAPHLIEHEGMWYLLIAEGGTERGHAVSIARGPSPTGPWAPCPANPLVSHRSTSHAIQNTGHADLVMAPDGSWWMVLLGVRSRGPSPGFHVLGRETFLAPLEWVDGWPVVGELELEMSTRPPGPAPALESAPAADRDDFDSEALDHRWITLRRPAGEFASTRDRPGWLTLAGDAATLDDEQPAFVGRRQQHHFCRVRTHVDPGSSREAGLTLRMDRHHHYDIAVSGDRIVARLVIGPTSVVVGEAPRTETVTTLVIRTTASGPGPDQVQLGFETGDGTTWLAEADGRYLSTEVAGGFIGRVIGLYAIDGTASFDWFDYRDDTATAT